jgi:hypothetical protein
MSFSIDQSHHLSRDLLDGSQPADKKNNYENMQSKRIEKLKRDQNFNKERRRSIRNKNLNIVESTTEKNITSNKNFFNPLADSQIEVYRFPAYLGAYGDLDESMCIKFEKINLEERENLFFVRSFFLMTTNIGNKIIDEKRVEIDFKYVA